MRNPVVAQPITLDTPLEQFILVSEAAATRRVAAADSPPNSSQVRAGMDMVGASTTPRRRVVGSSAPRLSPRWTNERALLGSSALGHLPIAAPCDVVGQLGIEALRP
jgi:hypothetical protein